MENIIQYCEHLAFDVDFTIEAVCITQYIVGNINV